MQTFWFILNSPIYLGTTLSMKLEIASVHAESRQTQMWSQRKSIPSKHQSGEGNKFRVFLPNPLLKGLALKQSRCLAKLWDKPIRIWCPFRLFSSLVVLILTAAGLPFTVCYIDLGRYRPGPQNDLTSSAISKSYFCSAMLWDNSSRIKQFLTKLLVMGYDYMGLHIEGYSIYNSCLRVLCLLCYLSW